MLKTQFKKELERGVEQIVLAELNFALYLATEPIRGECGEYIEPDETLIKSLSTAIQYFSNVEQISSMIETFQPIIDNLNQKFNWMNYEL